MMLLQAFVSHRFVESCLHSMIECADGASSSLPSSLPRLIPALYDLAHELLLRHSDTVLSGGGQVAALFAVIQRIMLMVVRGSEDRAFATDTVEGWALLVSRSVKYFPHAVGLILCTTSLYTVYTRR